MCTTECVRVTEGEQTNKSHRAIEQRREDLRCGLDRGVCACVLVEIYLLGSYFGLQTQMVSIRIGKILNTGCHLARISK